MYSLASLFFNKVETKYHREDKIPNYKEELSEGCPGANFFNKFIPDQVGFRRIGTKEENPNDSKNVREKFKAIFDDFKTTIR